MKLSSFAAVAVACTGFVALAVSLAGPSAADPPAGRQAVVIGVGSDTIQDVMNAFSSSMSLTTNPQTVGSWNAVLYDPAGNIIQSSIHSSITTKSGCTFTRPNGSGEGVNALRHSLNTSTTAPQLTAAPAAGCVDWARSSSGPAAADQSPTGQLVYVPFAEDAVATATGGTTNIAAANSFTVADLHNLYNCTTVVKGTVSYVPDGSVTDATHQPIHLYVPQAGSGTRNFWSSAAEINFPAATDAQLPACVHPNYTDGTGTHLVEEHDGSALAADPNGLAPFSIAQFISQANGSGPDRRHDATIHNVNGVAPLSGGFLNASFPINRLVYNVALFSAVNDQNNTLNALFAGPSSLLCSSQGQIRTFGFATIANCGSTTLRALNTI